MRKFEGYEKGVNMGGWLSQCGAGNYNKNRYDNFITEEHFKMAADWGLDHVRVPVDAEVIQTEDGQMIEEGLKYVDQAISWCRKYHLHMILDLHKAHGYVFDDESNCKFFYDAGLQDMFVYLWTQLAQRYSCHKDILTLELLNEVTSADFTDTWNKMARRTIEAIRTVDKDIRIMVGGIFNGSIYGLTLLDAPYDENIVFTFHCYSPLAFTHQGAPWVSRMPREKEKWVLSYPGTYEDYKARSQAFFGSDFDGEFPDHLKGKMGSEYFDHLFQPALRVAEKYNVPLYVGEYGVIELASVEDTIAWYKDINAIFKKYNLARAAWSMKQMDFGLSDARLDNDRAELIKYL